MKMPNTSTMERTPTTDVSPEKPTWRMNRRTFMAASMGGIAVAGAGFLFARTPVRLAIIGVGGQGTSIARAIRRGWWMGDMAATTVAVCDVDRNHGASVGAELGADVYHDYRKVL